MPKVSFSPALPLGTESLAEYLDVDLTAAIADENRFLLRLNKQLPRGITVLSVADTPCRKTDAAVRNLTFYTVKLGRELSRDAVKTLENFMDSDSFTITKIRKGKQRVLDIRKQVESLGVSADNNLELLLFSEEGKAGGKPVEILQAVFNFTDEECLDMKILKVWNKSV